MADPIKTKDPCHTNGKEKIFEKDDSNKSFGKIFWKIISFKMNV